MYVSIGTHSRALQASVTDGGFVYLGDGSVSLCMSRAEARELAATLVTIADEIEAAELMAAQGIAA